MLLKPVANDIWNGCWYRERNLVDHLVHVPDFTGEFEVQGQEGTFSELVASQF